MLPIHNEPKMMKVEDKTTLQEQRLTVKVVAKERKLTGEKEKLSLK